MSILKHIDTSTKAIKKFGVTFAILSLLIGGYLLYKHSPAAVYFVGISTGFFFVTLLAPIILKPLYVGWMAFAFVLAWINTRIILGAVFYLIFTPFGIIAQLVGKDFIDRKMNRTSATYWIKRNPVVFEKTCYEQMF